MVTLIDSGEVIFSDLRSSPQETTKKMGGGSVYEPYRGFKKILVWVEIGWKTEVYTFNSTIVQQ